jgi:hypothetical protein
MNRPRAVDPMKAGWLAALLVAVAWSGCAGGEPANPIVAAPKLVIAPRDDGNVTVYIHSAFGERAYEWIELRIDNVTRVNRTGTFSLEEAVPNGFYLEAQAEFGDALYQFRGRVEVFRFEERASVSMVGPDGEWPKEAESFSLPFEHLLERRTTQ